MQKKTAHTINLTLLCILLLLLFLLIFGLILNDRIQRRTIPVGGPVGATGVIGPQGPPGGQLWRYNALVYQQNRVNLQPITHYIYNVMGTLPAAGPFQWVEVTVNVVNPTVGSYWILMTQHISTMIYLTNNTVRYYFGYVLQPETNQVNEDGSVNYINFSSLFIQTSTTVGYIFPLFYPYGLLPYIQ